MSFVKSLPILRNLFGCSAASYTKTNRPGDTVTHVQVMPGATLKYESITDELCLTAASVGGDVGGECECKTLADSE
ncbi:hypothetical protein ACY12_000204 [Salmonella enterica subsp. enterica serovar Portland]|nr:hypothetical protein [Salmonella enterica subsp. enterica serovar Dortmund]ECA8969135.1 hypothetical protein [Salmonella enterica subsp. enterica serovar Omuna]ECE0503045.1 hypothetical protein [Salmonella enterica subsp. enterica]EDS6037912.1 hypothetical protein [Salmonella enterica subsp. enterica serovar Lexington]EEB9694276.1 hypothetical protein [Salmonella enterica subsp. enterica serovar Miami]EEJ7233028.1 hypothetical protein [Salmonella enterica subsp. salamae]EGZ4346321.1 hypoth